MKINKRILKESIDIIDEILNDGRLTNLKDFANQHDLKIVEINYNFSGISIKRKGFDLIDSEGYIQISIEPISYRKDSVYKKDKWLVHDYVNNRRFYVDKINNIPNELTGFIPQKTSFILKGFLKEEKEFNNIRLGNH